MSSKVLSSTLLLVLLCSVSCQQMLSAVSLQSLTAYNKWRFQNKRIYLNEEEQIFRQLIFLENFAKILEHNSNPNSTYKQALNQFSDMTEVEFTSKILNSALEAPNQKVEDHELITLSQNAGVAAPPPSVDWRTVGGVTPVKNQGQCGSCWAFSSAGVMESFNFKVTNQLKSFAEQQLVDCVIPANGYQSFGCSGGWPQQALAYSTKFGILQSSQYPYVGVQGACRVSSPSGFLPKQFGKLTNTADNLKFGIAYAPTSVLVDARTWGTYGSGVFNGCGSQIQLNHAVLAIGYDAQGNWIIKNSWSTGWGEQGYMRLAAGNTCGILSDNWLVIQ